MTNKTRKTHRVNSETISKLTFTCDSNPLDLKNIEDVKNVLNGMYKIELKATCGFEFIRDIVDLLKKHGLPVANNEKYQNYDKRN